MSLKQNSYRVLLWLLPTYQNPSPFTPTMVEHCVPQLSESGRVSLLYLLRRKQLISLVVVQSTWLVSLTALGHEALQAKFPALSRRSGQRQPRYLVTFLKPPSNDPSFRYLRTLLLEQRAVPIARGSYLLLRTPDQSLLTLTRQLYAGSVLITEVGQWIQGDELQIIGQDNSLADLLSAYSSISSQITQLLEKKHSENGLNVADKAELSSIFDRLFTILLEDDGLVGDYFPQVENASQLLKSLSELVTMG